MGRVEAWRRDTVDGGLLRDRRRRAPYSKGRPFRPDLPVRETLGRKKMDEMEEDESLMR